ncbi:MAG: hybrid sensor histidine kinase/response regulator [Polyangiaceae bacterium]
MSALPEGQPRNIEVAAWREGETVRMELKDNGIGVRPEDRERIFEPFVTTKTGGTGPRGTGLGLSIARTFAESMGTSGTRVEQRRDRLRAGPRRGRWKMKGNILARVLLVEDDDGNAADYLSWLGDAHYSAERARAASEAADLADGFVPDVILLDLQIPSVPGAADADVVHGLRALDDLVRRDPFVPWWS